MKKYIAIPSDQTMLNKVTGEPVGDTVSFRRFYFATLLADGRWRQSYETALAAKQLAEAFDKTDGRAGSIIELELTLWEKLRDAAKSPTNGFEGWGSLGIVQLLDFIDAIVGASDTPPQSFVSDNGKRVHKTEAEARGSA